jgi:hypothetical protein
MAGRFCSAVQRNTFKLPFSLVWGSTWTVAHTRCSIARLKIAHHLYASHTHQTGILHSNTKLQPHCQCRRCSQPLHSNYLRPRHRILYVRPLAMCTPVSVSTLPCASVRAAVCAVVLDWLLQMDVVVFSALFSVKQLHP